jgi:HPt (histidine-containing phosphotransfer) domain-containing protein
MISEMAILTKQLDREFLQSYYKDMVDEVGEIFELFIDEMPADMNNVKVAFVEKNYKEAAESLHKIAPSFYNIGLPHLTKIVQSVEALIRQGEYEKAQIEMDAFEIELQDYMPAVIEESQRLASL